MGNWSYSDLKDVLENETPPYMVVRRDVLEENVDRIVSNLTGTDKQLRVASKSVRVPGLLEIIRDRAGDDYVGLMTFSPLETRFLADHGFDDFILAYPRVNRRDIEAIFDVHQSDATIRVMVDEPAHVRSIENCFKNGMEPVPVCIDVDMSYRPADLAHLGVRRSPIRSVNDFRAVFREVRNSDSVTFSGFMGYEAQIAGLQEENPFTPLKNPIFRLVKRLSKPHVKQLRNEIVQFLEDQSVPDPLVNVGGTGSVKFSASDPSATEVTVGSGFLQSHLFDYYAAHDNEPAYCFGLPVTRKPDENIATCQSGGFIASGPAGDDKAPVPFLPDEVEPVANEGFGEVQSPFQLPETFNPKVGDPLFFRPAKAGEPAERFNEYLLIGEDAIEDKLKTYRGYGNCFY